MLTREEFHKKIAAGVRFLDGATGSNLRNAGMPKGCCTEEWILSNPEALVKLQRAYAEAGSQIIYAPTFQAQPIALKTVGLEDQTEKINADLIALSRKAAPGCLIAGDLTTLAAFCDSWDEGNFDYTGDDFDLAGDFYELAQILAKAIQDISDDEYDIYGALNVLKNTQGNNLEPYKALARDYISNLRSLHGEGLDEYYNDDF